MGRSVVEWSELRNLAGARAGEGHDPVSRRAAIAAKVRKNPKEQFNNLLHHLICKLVAECLDEIPKSSAAGVDGMCVKQARENLNGLLPPILKQAHEGRCIPPPVRRAVTLQLWSITAPGNSEVLDLISPSKYCPRNRCRQDVDRLHPRRSDQHSCRAHQLFHGVSAVLPEQRWLEAICH